MKLGFKYFCTTTLLIIVINAVAFAQRTITITKVESHNGYIRVEWTVDSEEGIDHYSVLRSTGGNGDYFKVGDVGRGTFFIEDGKDLFRSVGQFFSYRIIAVDANGYSQGQSNSMGATYNSLASVAKRTWGSIKAMFR
jgi:hypothetical protein